MRPVEGTLRSIGFTPRTRSVGHAKQLVQFNLLRVSQRFEQTETPFLKLHLLNTAVTHDLFQQIRLGAGELIATMVRFYMPSLSVVVLST